MAAIISAYKFVNGYLVKMTWNEDGTGQGAMKTPDIPDVLMFLAIVAVGLVGFIILIINIIRLFKK